MTFKQTAATNLFKWERLLLFRLRQLRKIHGSFVVVMEVQNDRVIIHVTTNKPETLDKGTKS